MPPRWPEHVRQPLLSSRVMILCGAFARTRVRSPQIIDGRTEPSDLAQVSKLAALAGTKHTDRFPLAKVQVPALALEIYGGMFAGEFRARQP